MKKLIFLLVAMVTVFQCFSQQPEPRNMRFVPMGSFTKDTGARERKVHVDAFWMSDEVTNREYKEFMNDLKKHPGKRLTIINPVKIKESGKVQDALEVYTYGEIYANVLNETVWKDHPNHKNYFTAERYADFPVVGVTRQNARLYCAWKAKRENEHRKKNGLPEIPDYRIPSESEWEYAAYGYVEPKNVMRGKEPAPAKSWGRNDLGLHNLCGNVSEWTISSDENDQVVVKGSSWKREIDRRVQMLVPEDFTANDIGFRMVRSYLQRGK